MNNVKFIDNSFISHRKRSQQTTRLNHVPLKESNRFETIRLNDQPMSSSNLINTKTSSSTTYASLSIDDRRHTDEINAEKIFRRIIQYCQTENIPFVDDQFPPIARSIGQIDSINNHPLKWLRISDISPLLKSDLTLKWSIYSSPKPSDIQQGALGDCWLMAALSLITERPQMLEHIFLTKTINKQGVYLVRICHNGLWKTVIVDDSFPCTQHNQLAFTQAHRRQLYVPLIEKACAKLFGSYADLISGQTDEGLQLLTGAPCDHIDLNPSHNTLDKEVIWAKLLSACESHLLIGASTGRLDVNIKEYARNNIPNSHAFSVLAARSLSHISMNFVLVRDPHARSNYIDELVTSSIRNQLNTIHRNDRSPGAFWISWPRFLRFFNSVTISSYENDYYDVREVNRFTHSSSQLIPTFQFHLSKTSLVNVSLLSHRQNRQIRNYHTQSFILCNVEQGPLKEVGTYQAILRTSRRETTHWIGSLSPGFYILIPFSTSFWKEDNTFVQDYTVIIHSKVQINVQVTSEPTTLLADCLIATTVKNKTLLHKRRGYNYYVTTTEYDIVMLVTENLSSTDFLNVEIDLDDSTRIHNSRKFLSTYDCIPPRHRQITFLIEWTNKCGEQARLDYSHRFEHVKRSNSSISEIYSVQNDLHSFRPF